MYVKLQRPGLHTSILLASSYSPAGSQQQWGLRVCSNFGIKSLGRENRYVCMSTCLSIYLYIYIYIYVYIYIYIYTNPQPQVKALGRLNTSPRL